MKKKRIITIDDHGTRELDKLVEDELDAFEKKMLERQNASASGSSQDEDIYTDNIKTKNRNLQRRQTYSLNSKSLDQDLVRDFDDPKVIEIKKAKQLTEPGESRWKDFDAISPELEVELDDNEKVLFDKEEEEFITTALEFLKFRDNKDTIISRIWNLLTEIEPESFFSPDPEESQSPYSEKPLFQGDSSESQDEDIESDKEKPEKSE